MAQPSPARAWPIPPMDHAAGHKPSAFTWAMGHLILQRVADRETMKVITADPRMPAYATVFRWVKMVPEFGEAYGRLRVTLAKVRRAEAEALRALKAEIKAEGIAARAAAKGKAPRHWKAGAKSTYTPQMAQAVCAAIAAGASMSQVTAAPGMPSSKAVYGWMRARPDFREAYMAACDERAMQLRMRIDMAVDACTPFTLAATKRKVAALEARLGRVRPKLYRRRELEW